MLTLAEHMAKVFKSWGNDYGAWCQATDVVSIGRTKRDLPRGEAECVYLFHDGSALLVGLSERDENRERKVVSVSVLEQETRSTRVFRHPDGRLEAFVFVE